MLRKQQNSKPWVQLCPRAYAEGSCSVCVPGDIVALSKSGAEPIHGLQRGMGLRPWYLLFPTQRLLTDGDALKLCQPWEASFDLYHAHTGSKGQGHTFRQR